jgi:hypothetical protein
LSYAEDLIIAQVIASIRRREGSEGVLRYFIEIHDYPSRAEQERRRAAVLAEHDAIEKERGAQT